MKALSIDVTCGNGVGAGVQKALQISGGLPDVVPEYGSVKSDAVYGFAASAGVEPYQVAS